MTTLISQRGGSAAERRGAWATGLMTTTILVAAAFAAPGAALAQDNRAEGSEQQTSDSIALGRVRVEASEDGEADTASQPGPTTTVTDDDIRLRFSGDPQGALRSIPGVSTRQASNQPGIEVNIRGMSGYGRVNAMIDGVPQTFRNIAGHEASGGSLLYVHPELLGGVSVTRGAVPGAHGGGTLTGAANFRTVSVDDVLLDGRTLGALIRLKRGDNGATGSGALALGARYGDLWGGDGEIDIIAAYAQSEVGDFRGGGDTQIIAARRSGNEPSGALIKFGVSPNEAHRFALGVRTYENEFFNSSYNWAIENQTWTVDYVYAPGSDWVNLTANVYYNRTGLNYFGTGGSYVGRDTRTTGSGLYLTNRVRTELASNVGFNLDYGVTWGREDFETLRRRGGNAPGVLDKGSVFSDFSLDFGRTSLIGGLRYDYWAMDGYRLPYPAGQGDCPAGGPPCGGEAVSRDGGEWLPKIGATFDVIPGLTLYATYAHTFRPPTTHETFFTLIPIGDGVGNGLVNNLDLDPETNRGWDAGARFHHRGLFAESDSLRFTIGYFNNRIENFIVNDFVNVPGRGSSAMWVNRPGETTMQGFEIEGGYDARFLYANFSYASTDTDDQPIGDGAGAGNGEASILPETTATLDLGTRLLRDNALRFGVQARYTGESKVAQFGTTPQWMETDAYTLLDVYGAYTLNQHGEIYFTVENAEDKRYGYASSSLGGFQAQTGRGRTFVVGVTARF